AVAHALTCKRPRAGGLDGAIVRSRLSRLGEAVKIQQRSVHRPAFGNRRICTYSLSRSTNGYCYERSVFKKDGLPMKQYFFDIVSDERTFHDFQGRHFASDGEASQHAQL